MKDLTGRKFAEASLLLAKEIDNFLKYHNFVNIVIAGSSCSGKTTLSLFLKILLSIKEHSVLGVSQDDYFKDLKDMPRDKKLGYMTDSPKAFHEDEFVSDFTMLYQGQPVRIPEYDIASNTRICKTKVVRLCEANIFEGLHAIHLWKQLEERNRSNSSLRELIERKTLKIYVDTSPGLCLQRRVERDTTAFGVSPEFVVSHWNNRIMPMNREFIYPQKKDADIVVCMDV